MWGGGNYCFVLGGIVIAFVLLQKKLFLSIMSILAGLTFKNDKTQDSISYTYLGQFFLYVVFYSGSYTL